MLFECGEAAFFQPWQLNVSRLGHQAARARRKSKKGQEQEQEGRRKSSGKSKKNSQFLAASESNSWQAVARRPVPSFTAVLFECGEAASFEPWQLNVSRRGHQAARAKRESKKGQEQEQEGRRKQRQKQQKIASFLQLQKATLDRPLPGGPCRPSLPCCLRVAKPLFSSLGSWTFRGVAIRQQEQRESKKGQESRARRQGERVTGWVGN